MTRILTQDQAIILNKVEYSIRNKYQLLRVRGNVLHSVRILIFSFAAMIICWLLCGSSIQFCAQNDLHYKAYQLMQQVGYEPVCMEHPSAFAKNTPIKMMCIRCLFGSPSSAFFSMERPQAVTEHVRKKHAYQQSEYCWYCDRWFRDITRCSAHYCPVARGVISPFGIIWVMPRNYLTMLNNAVSFPGHVYEYEGGNNALPIRCLSTLPQELQDIAPELLHPKFREHELQPVVLDIINAEARLFPSLICQEPLD